MAAESSSEIEPSANGTGHAAAPLDSNAAAENQAAAKDTNQKVSAAEKRRQRKKKNKQAKQIERQPFLHAMHTARQSSICRSVK